MNHFGEPTFSEKTLPPGLTPRIGPERGRESPPTRLPTKRSLAACAFLLGYVAVYLGVGFLGISLIEYAWSAVLR
jgi:hypothetical protein